MRCILARITYRLVLSLFLCCAASVPTALAALVEATGDGMAPGDQANAREVALTDALRDAVRKGAGVDIASQSRVTDFVLDYDRIFAASFGYVREYSILKSGMGSDGIYRVQVRAKVGEGNPDVKDILALRQIVHLKQSPRVAIEIDELIEGIPAGSDYARVWFENMAREMQLHLVDVKRAVRQDDRLSRRDDVLGDARTAELRKADIAQDADFILQVKIRGHYVGTPPYGMAGHVYSMGIDLRAIRPDSAAVIASIPVPGSELISEFSSKEEAARDIVHRMLAGTVPKNNTGALPLFRKIFAQWITELDLGAIARLEFRGLGDADHDRLVKLLGQAEKITAVWPREFDSQGLSFVDVESRLDSTALKAVVLKSLGGAFVYDAGTTHYLQFRGTGVSSPIRNPQSANIGESQSPTSDPKSSMPAWLWALIGAGAVLVVVGIFWLGRVSRK